MTQKQLTTIVVVTFLVTIGILAAFVISDLAKTNISNPLQKALQGQQQPK